MNWFSAVILWTWLQMAGIVPIGTPYPGPDPYAIHRSGQMTETAAAADGMGISDQVTAERAGRLPARLTSR